MTFLAGSANGPEEYTDRLVEFVQTPLVRQITGGIHVNDALIYDAWEALPHDWTAWWDSLPDHRLAQQHLINSIDEDERTTAQGSVCADEISHPTAALNPPASLGNWLDDLRSLSIPRVQRPGPQLLLPDVLKSRMNTKKIDEVSAAAAYIEAACRANGITHVIDMGSGQGYLSVALAYLFPSLHVLAIDGSESQVAGSKSFAASLGIDETKLCHLVRYIDGTAPLVAEMAAWAGGQRCMLVGLHACGQLSEHMLRYFTTLPWIALLGAVGCCYNHIVPRSHNCPDGFPISARLRTREVALSATAMMTGCQAPNNWEKVDLSRGETAYAKRRFYRALLEKLFHDKNIGIGSNSEERPAWGTRKGDLVSFESFTRRAMQILGVSPEMVSGEEIDTYKYRYRGYEGRIAILWTLSVLCCKVVESVIAMDRYWFLTEQGAEDVDILTIFDYRVSPRNLMMTATKLNI
ncbi:methyltransferase domain-containing protein [Xylariales sp. PMI_506]|nr:methyltransferase domain-containing protein [Xylariales sp. PMI_506]